MTSLARFVVYVPAARAPGLRAKALREHKSISAYLQTLIDQDHGTKPDPVQSEIERLHKRIGEVLEFSRYMMVVQNATADRISPGLIAEVQKLYSAEFGGAPDAR
ncbi:MAG: hypothetical protein ACRYG4_01780 [Janthinobacterium lividum]